MKSAENSYAAKFRKYFTKPADARLFLRIAAWAICVPPLLRFYSLDELLVKITPSKTDVKHDARKVSVFVNWWLNRNVLTLKPRCLNRSLLLYRFLRESGEPVRIHYGVKHKSDGKLDGHSWITIDGAPVAPDGDVAGEFHETFSYPPENSQGC